MKNVLFALFAVCTLLTACSNNNKDLSREEAMNLLKQQTEYPKVVDYDLFCGDPAFARKVLDAGLEDKGLLTVQRTQKLGDVGKPIIQLTDKAQPYLLPTPEKDKSINVQKVKLAEEELKEVTGIKMTDDGRLRQHNEGASEYTSHKRPWKLVCLLVFTTKTEALIKEKKLKKYSSVSLIALINSAQNILNDKG